MYASLAILYSAAMFALNILSRINMVFMFILFISIHSSFASACEWSLPDNFLHKNASVINQTSCFGMSWQTVAIGTGVFMGINAMRHYFLKQPALRIYRNELNKILNENAILEEASEEHRTLIFKATEMLASCDNEIKWSRYKSFAYLITFCGIAAWHLPFIYFK